MNRKEIIIALVAAVFVAMILSHAASSLPDGLEKIATELGFAGKAGHRANLSSATISAIATFGIFIITYGVALLIMKLKKRTLKCAVQKSNETSFHRQL